MVCIFITSFSLLTSCLAFKKTLGRGTKRVVDMFCTSQELVAESEHHLELNEDTEFDIE